MLVLGLIYLSLAEIVLEQSFYRPIYFSAMLDRLVCEYPDPFGYVRPQSD
jgi:hypothetical protein